MTGTLPAEPGFLLIDKAPGWTSHDVVAKARGILGMKKVGHAGTLDPMATGLLILGLGRATRLLRFVQDLPKVYVATALFGVATDTLDADGAVLSRSPMPVGESEVREAMRRFEGDILQVPPMVSALKVGGTRLYELARRGEEVERAARPVHISALDLIDLSPSDYPEVTFRVRCSSGTYVRTLGDDIAAALGGRAHLTSLRRISIGSLHADDALSIDELPDRLAAGGRGDVVVPPATALRDLTRLTVDGKLVEAVRHGVAIPVTALGERPVEDTPLSVLDPEGDLIAVYRSDGNRIVAEVVMA